MAACARWLLDAAALRVWGARLWRGHLRMARAELPPREWHPVRPHVRGQVDQVGAVCPDPPQQTGGMSVTRALRAGALRARWSVRVFALQRGENARNAATSRKSIVNVPRRH